MSRDGFNSQAGRTIPSTKQKYLAETIAQVTAVSEEQFRDWYNRRSHLPLAVNGHTLVLERDDTVRVDGGRFVYEETQHLVKMLNSRNPFTQLNATVMIWERNGVLKLIVVALIALILVTVILLARR